MDRQDGVQPGGVRSNVRNVRSRLVRCYQHCISFLNRSHVEQRQQPALPPIHRSTAAAGQGCSGAGRNLLLKPHRAACCSSDLLRVPHVMRSSLLLQLARRAVMGFSAATPSPAALGWTARVSSREFTKAATRTRNCPSAPRERSLVLVRAASSSSKVKQLYVCSSCGEQTAQW